MNVAYYFRRARNWHMLCLTFFLQSSWILLLSAELFAQGFNWQYSARFPTGYPRTFIGISGGGALGDYRGAISYKENDRDGNCFVCGEEFRRGAGNVLFAGAHGEYWLEEGNIALYGTVRYEVSSGDFRARSTPYPLNPSQNLVTEYVLASSYFHTTLEFGGKYKFYPLPIFAFAGVHAGYMLTFNRSLVERIVEPVERRFLNGAQERVATGILPDVNRFYAGVRMGAGVDVPLAQSLYAAPAFVVMLPALSFLQDASLYRLGYGVQISIVYGIQ